MNNLQLCLLVMIINWREEVLLFSVLNGGMLEFFLFSSERLGARICSCVLNKILGNVLLVKMTCCKHFFGKADEF